MPRNRNQYLEQVAKFIQTNGPAFTLDDIKVSNARACDCCGYYPIVNHFHVANTAGKVFVIGSECQEWVLDLKDAHLPASKVRTLETDKLVELGSKYSLTLDATQPREELAKAVIAARRKHANAAGWISRRLQGKAPVKPVSSPTSEPQSQLQMALTLFQG